MLRITIQESLDAVTLILEGRLTGPWIGEVERAWSAVAGRDNGRHVVVDLSGVTFIEEEGKLLLRRIYERGGELHADDVMTKAIVEDIQQWRP
jgi:anti-anti-sigma regulatory factor